VDTLVEVLQSFGRIVVTPNVLTEACDVARQVAEPARSEATRKLAVLSLSSSVDERYIPSAQAAREPLFERLGLSDMTMMAVLDAETCLLTADLDLYLESLNAGREAYNFNHVRVHGWQDW